MGIVEDPATSAEFLTASQGLIVTFGLMAVVVASSVIGLAFRMLRRARTAAG